VDFPTPPFWFAIAMIRAGPGDSGTRGIRFFLVARAGARAADLDRADDEEGWEEGALTARS
jgi:hypothetical protein